MISLPLLLLIIIGIIVLLGWRIIKFAIKVLAAIFIILLILGIIYVLPELRTLIP
jgi:hypothetical protein